MSRLGITIVALLVTMWLLGISPNAQAWTHRARTCMAAAGIAINTSNSMASSLTFGATSAEDWFADFNELELPSELKDFQSRLRRQMGTLDQADVQTNEFCQGNESEQRIARLTLALTRSVRDAVTRNLLCLRNSSQFKFARARRDERRYGDELLGLTREATRLGLKLSVLGTLH